MNNYQIVLDLWEGDVNLDVVALKSGGVKGLIVRLNAINGGLHMDDHFSTNWALAQQFPARSIYFVYNPWVDGATNYDWLVSHLPQEHNCRIWKDVEVVYPGYAPATYAKEVARFQVMVSGSQPPIKLFDGTYTGQGSLDLLSKWPGGDYWWAQYLFTVQAAPYEITWEELKSRINKLPDAPTNNKFIPGPCKLWQISDHMILPGMGGRAVDLNVFSGTEEELIAYFHPAQEVTTMSVYKNFAHGVGVDKTNTIDPQAVSPDPDFIVAMGYNGENGQDPSAVIDPHMSDHIQQAAVLGLPCFVIFRPFQDTWRDWMNPPAWGEDWNDKVLDRIVHINAIVQRAISGIIFDVRGVKFANGDIITQTNWRRAVERLFDEAWKAYHIDLYVMMGTAELAAMPADSQNTAIEGLNHLNALTSVSIAQAVSDGAGLPYPPDTWKPNYSNTNCGRVFLSYYGYNQTVAGISGTVDLWQYDRAPQAMREEIVFQSAPAIDPVPVPTPTPTPTPEPAPVVPSGATVDLSGVIERLDTLVSLMTKLTNPLK